MYLKARQIHFSRYPRVVGRHKREINPSDTDIHFSYIQIVCINMCILIQ